MNRAVLVDGPNANTKSVDGSVNLFVPAGQEKLGRSMLAAAGVSNVKITPTESAEAILLLSGTKSKAVKPYKVSYRNNIVKALIPQGKILIGSMTQLMPDVDWTTDPGGMVIEFPGPKVNKAIVSPWKLNTKLTRSKAKGSVVIKVNELPAKPIGIRGPVLRVILQENKIRGVPIHDGDVVLDASGMKWFVKDKELLSHREAWVDQTSVVQEGNVIRPMRAKNGLKPSEVPFAVGDKLELTLKGGGTLASRIVYGIIKELDGMTWVFEQTKELDLISDAAATCFGYRDAINAADCVSKGGVWDRPCKVDTECPFFDSSRGRGGCNSGICEMPLGVANKTFRSADPKTPPMCYNDGANPFCK